MGISLRTAVIVDVDGTLCDIRTIRHLLEGKSRNFHAFHAASADCPPHADVVRQVMGHHRNGHTIVVVTARTYMWDRPG